MIVDTIEATAHDWLMDWAKWARNGSGLGYPRRWVTERAREGGILAGSPRPPTEMPDRIAIIDRAVAGLGHRNRSMLAKALTLQYLNDNTIDFKATKCRTSVQGFRALLRRAQRQVYFLAQSFDTPLQIK